jgi:hypothetical protein
MIWRSSSTARATPVGAPHRVVTLETFAALYAHLNRAEQGAFCVRVIGHLADRMLSQVERPLSDAGRVVDRWFPERP